MTNAMIILMESVKLMEEGKLKGTGKFVEVETQDGKKQLEIPEAIHTYAKWKELGYQVRRGENPRSKFRSGNIAEKLRQMRSQAKQSKLENVL